MVEYPTRLGAHDCLPGIGPRSRIMARRWELLGEVDGLRPALRKRTELPLVASVPYKGKASLTCSRGWPGSHTGSQFYVRIANRSGLVTLVVRPPPAQDSTSLYSLHTSSFFRMRSRRKRCLAADHFLRGGFCRRPIFGLEIEVFVLFQVEYHLVIYLNELR